MGFKPWSVVDSVPLEVVVGLRRDKFLKLKATKSFNRCKPTTYYFFLGATLWKIEKFYFKDRSKDKEVDEDASPFLSTVPPRVAALYV